MPRLSRSDIMKNFMCDFYKEKENSRKKYRNTAKIKAKRIKKAENREYRTFAGYFVDNGHKDKKFTRKGTYGCKKAYRILANRKFRRNIDVEVSTKGNGYRKHFDLAWEVYF